MKKVMFITNIRTPDAIMSSTDIMTMNLIQGLSKNNLSLSLMILIDDERDKEKYNCVFKKYSDRIYYIKRKFHDGQNPFITVLGSLFFQFFSYYYKREISSLRINETFDIIISNKVTIDEIIIGKIVKKITNSGLLYQYWSDPMTLSGIYLSDLKKTPRRWIFKLIEKKAIRNCDRIIYGTKTLKSTQCKLFKRFSSKMSYIDIGYCEKESIIKKKHLFENKILYAGNYYSSTRDVSKLVEAIEKQDFYKLDVYGKGDYDFSHCKNVTAHGRIAKEELDQICNSYSIQVCVLNNKCSQIPGKIFYDIDSDINIIVIVDGKMRVELTDYLKSYCRFNLVDNNVEDIMFFLKTRMFVSFDFEKIKESYCPQRIAQLLLMGGIK